MALTRLDSGWRCLACGDHGAGDRSDRMAEKHTRDTGHPTATRSTPTSGTMAPGGDGDGEHT